MARLVKILCFVLILAVFLSSCGRKSQVKPPEERAPAPVRSIVLDPKQNSIKLTWRGPSETVSGEDLLFLNSFNILRRIVQKNGKSSYSEIAVISVSEDADTELEYSYEDKEVTLGTQYDYLIVPRDNQGIEGTPDQILRVSYLGPGSLIESLPFLVEE